MTLEQFLIFIALLVIAVAWYVYQTVKSVPLTFSENNDLELQCCFCDYWISRSSKIVVGEYHQCPSCDSDIQALRPEKGSHNCRIGKWRSTYA